ncbi:D-isomer specific 2-hydroxyacid dehydrogenase family protein [Corynebacterium breve]|uniref:D-isomer specific 2-hydroxyacid dehydrogenase family protein n=1 Tax=Corynebacterium breve TaxID=3049799 RepID=A0ABY8VFW2_9CORY|nr:D-isomer specific 2-hydroxyacid dehydrogenase family protein [Corynebacterium breve]WIM67158.1 D-isomer specific 2-hydroxyacid dehydrogenase family protein [Corynebacterium breve]
MKFTMLPTVWDDTVADIESAGHTHVALDESPDLIVFNGGADDFPDALPDSVKVVQCAFAGIDALDQAGILRKNKVRWVNAAGVYDDTVAESTIALLLAVLHQHKYAKDWSARPSIAENQQFLFENKTVAVIGAGGIGERLIKLLNVFGCTTIAVTRSGREVSGATVSMSTSRIDEAWETADYFVLLTPLTDDTRGMVNRDVLQKMKPNAVVINVGRGPLIVTDDLVEALHKGTIFGAGLDVTDPEPLPNDHPLWSLDNCVITPHTANTEKYIRDRVGALTRYNWEAFSVSQLMPTEVNVEHGY